MAAEAFLPLLGGGPPSPAVVGLAMLAVAAALLITRVLSNAFPGRKPPIVEGVPFVGGLLKFAKVRSPSIEAARWRAGVRAGRARTAHPYPPPLPISFCARAHSHRLER